MNIINIKQPKGLNKGNCYLNSLLQCFYYCQPMTKFFLSLSGKDRLGVISKGYYDFVHYLHSGSLDAALYFQKALMHKYESFKLNKEKNSKDLIFFILSELNQELTKENNLKPYKSTIYYNPYELISVYKEKLNLDKINKDNTIITNTFFLIFYIDKDV